MKKAIDPHVTKINGPINIVRLEGNIHRIEKVIYLLMDFHIPVQHQSQCENIFSQDVQTYLAKNFYELNKGSKVYDFFLEIYPHELSDKDEDDYKNIYIEEIVKFFKRIFVHHVEKNKVLVSDLFKKVRLHYLDVRGIYYVSLRDSMDYVKEISDEFVCQQHISFNQLKDVIETLSVLKKDLDVVIKIMSQVNRLRPKVKLIKTMTSEMDVDALRYVASKIQEKYKHEDVKKHMNKLIEKNISGFVDLTKDINEAIEKFKSYYRNEVQIDNKLVRSDDTREVHNYGYGQSVFTSRQTTVDIADRIDHVSGSFIKLFADLTDIYFLRRFLDKDYITNAIVYTGAEHSVSYIHELVKTYDFKITHASYSKIPDMDKLTRAIKQGARLNIQEFTWPPIFKQCSDISSFPNNFL